MHKAIFSTVVVVLAGTCWVLAQNASSKPWVSPYGGQRPALSPKENAELLVEAPRETTVAPTTELQAPPLPPAAVADLPVIPIAPVPEPAPVPNPPVTPPLVIPDMLPTPTPAPGGPTLPRSEVKPPVVAPTRAAREGLPPLPPIPGVAAQVPMTLGVGGRYDGIVVPPANSMNPQGGPAWTGAPPREVLPPPKGASPTPVEVDPPNYWRDRQRLIDRWNEREYPERTLGPRIWGGADYLFWFVRPQTAPALVQAITGASSTDTSFSQSQVVTLFPYNGKIETGISSGVRGNIGFWLNSLQTIGFEASYMWFAQSSADDSFRSRSDVILGRPFVNADTGGSSLYQVSSLDGVDGLITVRDTFNLQGGEANFLFNSLRFAPRLNLIAGFRYLDMSEQLQVSQYSDGSGFALSSFDRFMTRNQYWGGQVGLKWTYQGRRLFANIAGKIGVGAINQRVRINGSTSLTTDSGTQTETGGVLALASNIGTYDRTRATLVPEAVVSLGYRITPWATATVGYNFLYVTDVVRPGGQIDTSVNTDNFPGGGGTTGRPAFSFKSEEFWMQGINFGLTLQY